MKTHAPLSSVGHSATLLIVRSEVASTTRQMIVYLAIRPPFPPNGHALCTSVTHSLHLYSNFLFLYLLVRPVLGPVLDYISPFWTDVRWHLSAFRVLPLLDKHQYSSSGLGVPGGALSFLIMNGISGSFFVLLPEYYFSPKYVMINDLLMFGYNKFFTVLLLFLFLLRTCSKNSTLLSCFFLSCTMFQYCASVLHNAIALLLLLIVKYCLVSSDKSNAYLLFSLTI